MNAIRNSTKAIIIKNGCLLTVKGIDSDGDWYLLPGGGQNPGETLKEALWRECMEEIGIDVSVGRLRYIREYIGKNHEFSERDGDAHQVEFMFECEFDEEQPPKLGNNPDAYQVDIAWLPIDEIHEYRIYPKLLGDLLMSEVDNDNTYLGMLVDIQKASIGRDNSSMERRPRGVEEARAESDLGCAKMIEVSGSAPLISRRYPAKPLI